MNPLRRLARRFRFLFRRDRAEAEMAEEMRFHLEQRAADLAADGLSETEARFAAQKKFGNTGSLQERARDTWGWGWLERALKDFRFAVRQARRLKRRGRTRRHDAIAELVVAGTADIEIEIDRRHGGDRRSRRPADGGRDEQQREGDEADFLRGEKVAHVTTTLKSPPAST